MADGGRIELFLSLGLSKAKAEETIKNAALSQRLEQAISEVGSPIETLRAAFLFLFFFSLMKVCLF